MIPVRRAQVSKDFEVAFARDVNAKGLEALAEMVGEVAAEKRRGRRRKAESGYARREDIPAKEFPPLWRAVLPNLLELYERRSAYLAVYLEHGKCTPTVDHFVSISTDWTRAYDWSNYRLAAHALNTRKGVKAVLDPFELDADTFALEWVNLQVVRGVAASTADAGAVSSTMDLLNHPEFCKLRATYVEDYELGPGNGGVDLAYLERRAPFVAGELRRQGRLLRGDR